MAFLTLKARRVIDPPTAGREPTCASLTLWSYEIVNTDEIATIHSECVDAAGINDDHDCSVITLRDGRLIYCDETMGEMATLLDAKMYAEED